MVDLELQPALDIANTIQANFTRAALYNLFATLLSRTLDDSWLNPYFQMHLQTGLPETAGKEEMLKALKQTVQEPGYLRKVRLEYDALFLVPGPRFIFPYESCYTYPKSDGTLGRLWQAPALHMHRILSDWGIEFAEGWELIPDHIGVELYFMAELCRLAAEKEMDSERLEEWQWEFFRAHLQPWVFKLIDNLEQKARTGFYRGAARLLRGFLLEEGEALKC